MYGNWTGRRGLNLAEVMESLSPRARWGQQRVARIKIFRRAYHVKVAERFGKRQEVSKGLPGAAVSKKDSRDSVLDPDGEELDPGQSR